MDFVGLGYVGLKHNFWYFADHVFWFWVNMKALTLTLKIKKGKNKIRR